MNHIDTVHVSIEPFLSSINSLDEISGEMIITLMLNMTWKEERMTWVPAEYDNMSSLVMESEDLWKPKLYLRQSAFNVEQIGEMNNNLKVVHNGDVIWSTGNVIRFICPVDATYFPYDNQTCELSFSSLSHSAKEMTLNARSEEVNISFYSINSQWEFTNGPVHISNAIIFNIDLKIKRKSGFLTVYIIIPLVFLGCINGFVFLMPASSGERTSVAITVFLSFVVYMQVIHNQVPQSSAPVPYIFYYILTQMIYSVLVLFLCIISLRVHSHTDEVPKGLKILVSVLRCRCKTFAGKKCIKQTAETKPGSALVKVGLEENARETLSDFELETTDGYKRKEITWKVVGDTYDIFCSVIMSGAFWTFSGVSIMQMYLNIGLISEPL
ncbi:acetylcholine receptor subunit delta-like [Mya arenaria]|uniref:acetylcholine receptor subunit delta-like n=1 Tax=Mya arenaria TaxID=6604 RepID=UPI0022E17BFB|nr:acetylcholine receptor subunit delta-like [Mya arenaria]